MRLKSAAGSKIDEKMESLRSLRPAEVESAHCSFTRIKGGYHNDTVSSVLIKKGFRLGKRIGEGSYCNVREAFKATELGFNEKLACKVVDKKKASKEFVTKFLPREISIVKLIRHPHIVTVFKIIELDDHVYMFMDFCSRGDLLDHIRTKGAFTETRAKHFFR